jgi:NitT/TauT family transport system ATP-binding protein
MSNIGRALACVNDHLSTAESAYAPRPMPVVELRGIIKRYRSGVVAVESVDLDAREGEFLAVLGPSGCGKSTLLRIAAGLAEPSRGSRALGAAASRPGGIGFVFQEPTLMPWASVFDNVFLPLKLAGEGRAAARGRVEEAIAAVGLGGFEQAVPRELSGGMRMRVSLARAYVTRPALLLLDEPFAAIDEITRFRLNDDLLLLTAAQRWTVVFVTHSVFEAVFLAERIVVMTRRPGRIHADIATGLPYPRLPELRVSTAYAEACRRVSDALAEAIA